MQDYRLCPLQAKKNYSQQISDKQLIYDAPKFKYLKEWWEKEGKRESKYLCPFHELVNGDRHYLYYDREKNDEAAKRLEEIEKILTIYPKLARTRGEVAYLLLDNESTFSKVEGNALEALKETDTETLPYLLCAYIALKRNQPVDAMKWIDSAVRLTGKRHVQECLVINKKLNILANPVWEYLHANNLWP